MLYSHSSRYTVILIVVKNTDGTKKHKNISTRMSYVYSLQSKVLACFIPEDWHVSLCLLSGCFDRLLLLSTLFIPVLLFLISTS